MSEFREQVRYAGVDRRSPRAEPAIVKPGIAPVKLYKPGGRHAAITNSLYNWHNYKTWTEKIRGNWDK